MIITTVTEDSVYNIPASTNICQGDSTQLPGGSWVNTAGTYYDTLTTISNCDSIIITTVTVDSVLGIPISQSICSGDSIFLESAWQYIAGTYIDTMSTSGCDSIVITTLTVDSAYLLTNAATICQGDSVLLPGGSWATLVGTYNDTLTTIAGCDSVITTTITVDTVYNIPASADRTRVV